MSLSGSLCEDLIQRIRKLSRPLLPIPTGLQPTHGSLSGIRAVLFDVYGTLFVSDAGDISASRREASVDDAAESLESAGIRTVSDGASAYVVRRWRPIVEQARALRRQTGADVPEIDIVEAWRSLLDEMVSQGLARGQIDEAVTLRLAVEFEFRTNPVWPMPDVRDMINGLKRGGLAMGLVSNGQFYTPLMFEALLGASVEAMGFDPALCVWSYRQGVAKPSPQLWGSAVDTLERALGILPREIVAVGNDMRNDVLIPAGLGCRTVLFAGDARSLRQDTGTMSPTAGAPTLVITSLIQLIQALLPDDGSKT